ncbi:MAG: DUF3148 domain-containing protein [Geminocystis sp.]|nr:DUF3148 domain-containing protein [Geminocystis sp.]HIK37828.1 DUF3148 domain-containing protein [Geminocystis sp. M7585_C2015_104]MCS7148715.1 DUF3148 domain-containing protein [Geminocystis sp.]MCX8078411.1 DUF3148 domain-containing protein [Geminocystis sp.]MDW8116136.1 DUF3148 domain-containing protein [Geminocystis sp.]
MNNGEIEIKVGDRIRVVALPPYLKTAEPMPMLRPNSLIQIGEEGIVVQLQPAGYYSVRFARGTFLLERQYFELVVSPSS